MPPPEPEAQADALPTGWPAEATRLEPRWVDAEPEPEPALPPPQAHGPEPAAPLAAEPAAAPAAVVPEFMRRAQRSARWSRPAVRAALASLALLLAVLLALQITLHFRDALAALHPPLRAPLQALCSVAGCEVKPWRRIEALGIDATSLNPVGSGNSYRLNLSLRNKSGVDVAPPWVELHLTDANGAPFASRVLAPEQMTPALKLVSAESENALSFSFGTGGQRVSGYSVNLFYP